MIIRHICFTAFSTDERKELSEKATNLGLEVDTNLEIQTDALIADRIGTDKYRLAIKKKIPILKKDWLIACESAKGLVNIDRYKLPCFFNCTISVTGFREKERKEIQKLCEQNGATFSTSLTTGFTHLICLVGGSPKFNFALSNNINVVTMDWVKNSVNAGYALDESDFILSSISEEEKQACYEIANKFKQQIGLETEEFVKPTVKQSILQTQAKLDIQSTESSSLCSQFSTEDVQLSLFNGLVFYLVGFSSDLVTRVRKFVRKYGGHATFTTHNLNYILANENTPEETIKNIKEKLNYDPPVVSYKWFQNCIENMQVLPIEETRQYEEKEKIIEGPVTSTMDDINIEIDITEEDLADAIHSQTITSTTFEKNEEHKLFSGMTFTFASNFSQKPVAKSLIENNGGKIVQLDLGLDYNYIIYPESCRTPRENNPKIRTLKWLTDSLAENIIKNAEDCILYIPTFRLALKKIKTENEKILIVISGYPEQKHLLQSIIEALDASTSKSMRKNADILVCEKKSDKSEFANKYNIPVVSEKWLIESYTAGYFLSPTEYIFNPNSINTPINAPINTKSNMSNISVKTDIVDKNKDNSTSTTPDKKLLEVKKTIEKDEQTPTKAIIVDENARDSSSPHTGLITPPPALQVDTTALANFKNKLLDKLPKKKDTTTKAIEFSEQSSVHFIPKKNLESLTFFSSQHASESNSLSHYGGTSEAENEYNEKVKNDRIRAPVDFSMSLGTFAETQVIDHDNEIQKTKWKQLCAKEKRHFLLSSLAEKQKKEIVKQIASLDGVIDDIYISGVTTHFIAGSAVQTEKFLCSVAAGIFILSPQYIEQSYKQQYWIREEGYQWIEKKDEIKAEQKEALRYLITGKKIQDSKTLPFSGMSVFFYQGSNASFTRIVAAGGARVLTSISDQCTHIFYDKDPSALKLKYPNIKITSEEDISALLMTDINEKKVPRSATSNSSVDESEKKKRKIVRKNK